MSDRVIDGGKGRVCVVEDDDRFAEAIEATLHQEGFGVAAFGDADDCLAHLQKEPCLCNLLLTDVKLRGMNGITLLHEVKEFLPSLPVIVVTGYADVPMTIRAFKSGATDFLEKPVSRRRLLGAVHAALRTCQHQRPLRALTAAERDVLDLLLEGKGNAEIARLRHRSVRTIEDQRHQVMHKLGVNNLVDLVKAVALVRMVNRDDEA